MLPSRHTHEVQELESAPHNTIRLLVRPSFQSLTSLRPDTTGDNQIG
ncbi:MAG: hypothetical protein J5I90_20840 [Caldilineales bacterium]|nr:hypothetical protein [Caldilineales bacterium]